MKVFVVLRNEEESGRRVFLGVYSSHKKAIQCIADDTEDLDDLYDPDDYDILETTVDDERSES